MDATGLSYKVPTKGFWRNGRSFLLLRELHNIFHAFTRNETKQTKNGILLLRLGWSCSLFHFQPYKSSGSFTRFCLELYFLFYIFFSMDVMLRTYPLFSSFSSDLYRPSYVQRAELRIFLQCSNCKGVVPLRNLFYPELLLCGQAPMWMLPWTLQVKYQSLSNFLILIIFTSNSSHIHNKYLTQ